MEDQEDPNNSNDHLNQKDSDSLSEEEQKLKRNYEEDEEEEDSVDEEDLELIAENYGLVDGDGQPKLKRLKKMNQNDQQQSPSNSKDDLDNLFSDEEPEKSNQNEDPAMDMDGSDQEEKQTKSIKYVYNAQEEQNLLDEDDEDEELDDFVVDDEGDEQGGQLQKQKKRSTKKKISKSAQNAQSMAASLGFSAADWSQVHDMFGDGEEYSFALNQENRDDDQYDQEDQDEFEQVAKSQQPKIEDIYEPAEVAEKMFTSRDEEIRVTDVPERYQLSGNFEKTPSEYEIQAESLWIAQKIQTAKSKAYGNVSIITPPQLITIIEKLLHLIKVKLFEIPFIVRHRRDLYSAELRDEDVWTVLELDEKWQEIQKKKLALQPWITVSQDPELADIIDSIQDLETAFDMVDYLQLRYKKQMEEYKQQQNEDSELINGKKSSTQVLKKPLKRDSYMIAIENGLQRFADQIALSSRQFANNALEEMKNYLPDDQEIEPLTLASSYVTQELSSPESVIRATRYMMSHQIASEPGFRQALRKKLIGLAKVNVFPTEKGKIDIDETHDYYVFKYLRDKPIQKIDELQYLALLKAAEEGLITFKVEFDLYSVIGHYEQYYLSDGYSSFSEKWNSERKKILREALDIIVPNMKSWIISTTRQKSISFILNRISNSFQSHISMKPHPYFDENSQILDEQQNKRGSYKGKKGVLAITCGSGDPNTAAFGAFVLEDGQVATHIKLNTIHSWQYELKNQDLDKLNTFIADNIQSGLKVIAISGWSIHTKTLYEDVLRLVQSKGHNIPVIYSKDETSRVYYNSKRSQVEFPQFPPLLKYAVGVARFVIDPLLEYASLFNSDRDATYIPLHHFQNMIPRDQIFKCLEKQMIITVNEVGVNINRLMGSTSAQSILQFVCGLGPRKAQFLHSAVNANGGYISNRFDLVNSVKFAPVIFQNCCSFIKIDENYLPRNSRSEFDILDSTRIHCEDYGIARKIAVDALGTYDDSDASESVRILMEEKIQALEDLDLDSFAAKLSDERNEMMSSRIQLIRKELKRPYNDLRLNFSQPNQNDLFTMLTGETDITLRNGMILPATAFRVKDQFIIFKLANGIDGYMSQSNMGEFADRPQDHFIQGQTYRAKVLSVLKDKFQVEMSALSSTDRSDRFGAKKDEYFDIDAEARDMRELNNLRPSNEQLKRTIKHPLFYNFSFRESQDYLKQRPIGACIFRPSSKGKDFLTLSLKLGDGTYYHLEIKENQKYNDFALGRELRLEGEVYKDLDEIVAFFVNPLIKNLKEAMQHPKFKNQNRDDVEQIIERDMLLNPRRVSYYVCIAQDKPGRLYLLYKMSPTGSVISEFISVNYSGFKFRSIIYKDLQTLINAFKNASSGSSAPIAESIQPNSRAPVSYGQQQQYGNIPQSNYMQPSNASIPYGYQPQIQSYGQAPVPGYQPPRPQFPTQQYGNNSQGNNNYQRY